MKNKYYQNLEAAKLKQPTKIDLANVKEVLSSISEYKKKFNEAKNSFEKIEAAVSNAAKPLVKAQNISANIKKEYKELQKQAKDLGIDLPKIVIDGVKEVSKLDDHLESIGNIIKKIK